MRTSIVYRVGDRPLNRAASKILDEDFETLPDFYKSHFEPRQKMLVERLGESGKKRVSRRKDRVRMGSYSFHGNWKDGVNRCRRIEADDVEILHELDEQIRVLNVNRKAMLETIWARSRRLRFDDVVDEKDAFEEEDRRAESFERELAEAKAAGLKVSR